MPVAESPNRQGRAFTDIASILFAQRRMIFVTDSITDGIISDLLHRS